VLQFTTQPDTNADFIDVHSSSDNITNPSNTIIDFAGNPIRSLLQGTNSPNNTIDILAGARSQAQSYKTVITDQNNQSVLVSCSVAKPCTSARILTATNNTSFDL
jgi:fibrillarin-like rRNA methylase